MTIFERAAMHGDSVAVRTDARSFSYQDLLNRSAVVAKTLLAIPGKNNAKTESLEEARVAYLIPAAFDYIATQWGIWRSGGVAVPLSLLATERELEYAITDSQASLVATTRELAPKIASLCDRLNVGKLVVDDITSLDPAKEVDSLETRLLADLPAIRPDHRAMILYTSGTTSKPKGVVTTHACIQAQIESLVDAWQWTAADRIPLFLPLHHIHGIINIMSCALWSGAEIEPFPRFELKPIFRRVAADAYTLFMAVPTIYVKLIEALESMAEEERRPIIDGFGRMRLMVSGSAALPASVHEQWTHLTGQKLLERYGMTEIGMALSNPYEGERRPGAVGLPLPGVEIRLCTEDGDDSESGKVITNENESGEIQVCGPNVFLEYWNRPEAMRESFQEKWFRTGDIAVLENGYYRIMGRSSVDIIKSGGYKLSALEIEATMLDHPAIRECAVVGVPDETWGELVAAAIVLQRNETLEMEAFQAWCKDKLSPYKIPRKLLPVEKLPRNAMGKITKPSVQKLFE